MRFRSHGAQTLFLETFLKGTMDLPDDVILGSPATSSVEAEEDDDPVAAPAGPVPRPRVRRVREAPAAEGQGSFAAWLICDTGVANPALVDVVDRQLETPARKCVAGACWVSWAFEPNGTEARSRFRALAPSARPADNFAQRTKGFLEYTVDSVRPFAAMLALDDGFDLKSGVAGLRVAQLASASCFADDGCAVADFLDASMEQFATPLIVAPAILSRVLRTVPLVVSSCRLTERITLRGRVPNQPHVQVIRAWVAGAGAGPAEPHAGAPYDVDAHYKKILLELPPSARRLKDEEAAEDANKRHGHVPGNVDPIRLVDGVRFCKFLRASANMKEALDAAHTFQSGRTDGSKRDSSGDIGRTSIQAATQRMDIVQILLDRREFEADRRTDNILHITLLSDSSPTTGEELQGQVADFVRRRGGHRRIILPGASLSYAQTDSINKSVGLLWCCWLIAGPTLQGMTYFLHHVRCICTDNGTEMKILETPDILHAFLSWVSGQELLSCAHLVRSDRRLFLNALRISGWGHAMGNLIKTVLNRFHRWPSYLEKVRLLVGFFNNKTYCHHIKRVCASRGVVLGDIMDHFSVNIAKWRYETVFVVFEALLKLRVLCETHLKCEMFQNVQDRETVHGAITAGQDGELWRFILSSFVYNVGPVEHLRRWGLICNCEEHLKMRHEENVHHISCWRNSRRLCEVVQRTDDEIADIKEKIRTMVPALVEGDVAMSNFTKNMLMTRLSELKLRTKHYKSLPWLFVNADSIEGAKNVVEAIERYPLDRHDPFTRDVLSRLGQDLRSRAAGGGPHASLERRSVFVQTDLVR